MKRVILLLFIPLIFLFNGCTNCEPQIVTKYIKAKKKDKVVLDKVNNCTMNKGVHYGDLNDTSFWVNKEKLVECSNTSMKRKDKNLFYEKDSK